ncbi:MAG: DNA polymerase Y family protein, partial [Bifidobacteriaceae bacterium]|nr:DNA polymerase Y family protein [Bifidobacteriaceae bacterium]
MGLKPGRLAAVWLPDWPVAAAILTGVVTADQPVIVADTRRVKAASPAARAAGVRSGMKRRAAIALCPTAQVVPADPLRDSRAFEKVAALVHSLVPGVELLRPGLLLCPAAGASRYYGSDEALAEYLLTQVAAQTGAEAWVGVADGLLAAILAARDGQIVPSGESRSYLAPRALRDLKLALRGTESGANLDVLLDLLARLGIKTLGDLATLPAANVAERLGTLGIWVQRLARAEGTTTGPGHQHQLPREFKVVYEAEVPMSCLEQALPPT